MPDPSVRQTLLEGLFRTRLQAIQVDDGYFTDAGSNVFLGEAPRFGPDDAATALAIVVADDELLKAQGKAIFLRLPVEIQCLATVEPDRLSEPWKVIEEMLADVKRAMEQDDELLHGNDKRSLARGVTRVLPRESGTTSVGVGITYVLGFQELWGQP